MPIIQTKSFKLAIYKNGDEKSAKLALVLPGKLDTKNYAHMRSHVDYLANRGYLALSFDPPGTWDSQGGIELYTMTNYVRAVHELIEYFGTQSSSQAKRKEIFVMGHSRGGSIAMLAGISNPRVTHFASIMSYYSFNPKAHPEYPDEDWKKNGVKQSKRDLPTDKNQTRVFNLPYNFLEDQIQYDMLDGLKNSKKPKLFVFGKKDSLVRPEVVKIAYEAAAQPKKLQEIDSDHDYRFHPELIEEMNEIIGDFLDTI